MEYSFGDEDIIKRLHGKTKVLGYRDLIKYKSVEGLLRPHGNVVIHYPENAEETQGHWTALMYSFDDKGKKIIEFFDPYGCEIDEAFEKMNVRSRPLLSNLLLKSNYDIHYNNKPLQIQAPNINTCGRHVVLRILNRNMSINKYARLLSQYPADEVVTFLTE